MKKQMKFGLQGPVVSWQDPWAKDKSDDVMRTGTGSVIPSQDELPEPEAFTEVLRDLGASFYVHHTIPGMDADAAMLSDLTKSEIDIVLGNEYGNINGPWVEGTNRYDVPDEAIVDAAKAGRLIGLLYDEPEHLQINVSQYRKDGWYPHWANTDGLRLHEARDKVRASVAARVQHIEQVLQEAGFDRNQVPVLSEHVFPTSFHTNARAGMAIAPKVMKESFESLQLSTAIGAAKQYNRDFWICADLWGPDVGNWFTRFHGLPGHSPAEYESALRMAYYMGPSHLFTENIDALLRFVDGKFEKTVFGEVWHEFIRKFVPENPITWDYTQADPDILIIHSDDSNYGQNERLYGNREPEDRDHSKSIFHIWHLLTRGKIPSHGSCMHIPGFKFPRHVLQREKSVDQFPLENGFDFSGNQPMHPLFYPANNVLVMDEYATDKQMGNPKVILIGGSSVSNATLSSAITRAEQGAIVVIGSWLIPDDIPENLKQSRRTLSGGKWIVTDNFLAGKVLEATDSYIGDGSYWKQRFGKNEVIMTPKDKEGFALDFEIKEL